VNILTTNTGSSSIRLASFTGEAQGLEQQAQRYHKPYEGTPETLLQSFLQDYKINDISVIAHRIVHGGVRFISSCIMNEEVEKEIDSLSSLAPLHNALALQWIRTCRAIVGSHVPQVAIFDTAFYADLPEVAKIYALPRDLCKEHDIRRYGFHGIAHKALWQRWKKLHPDIEGGGRAITIQLGSGCSITAINRGRPVDTSMGFSPLEGLIMATRAGDLDPGILLYLQKSAGISVGELDNMLNKKSGLHGVSGISSDMQDLLGSDKPEAHQAVELYCYRVKKYIGAYVSVLGGTDALLFGGGVGENAPYIRKGILENMKWCGIELDNQLNSETIGREGCISSKTSKVDVLVIPVDEAALLAQEAMAVVTGK